MNAQYFNVPNARPPRQTAFNAAVFIWVGTIVVFTLIGLATLPQQMYTASLLGLGWYPLYALLNGVIAVAALLLIWARVRWAYYVLCAQIGLGALLALSLPMSKDQAFIGPLFLAALTWAMHVGGPISMWRQMFGQSLLPFFDRGLAPTRSVMPPNRSAPRPAPDSRDPVEQLRQLVALRDSGAITGEEFLDKKTHILKRI